MEPTTCWSAQFVALHNIVILYINYRTNLKIHSSSIGISVTNALFQIINGKVCTQCKASITNQDQFYQHLRQHSGSSLAGNGSPTAQPVLPTVCIICRQTLVSDAEVRMHARHHYSPTELSPCSVCLQGYDRRDLMGGVCKECHHRHLNGKTTPSRCSDCQLKFETGPALEAHIASVHRKSFQCVKSQVKCTSLSYYRKKKFDLFIILIIEHTFKYSLLLNEMQYFQFYLVINLLCLLLYPTLEVFLIIYQSVYCNVLSQPIDDLKNLIIFTIQVYYFNIVSDKILNFIGDTC